jgi:ankyrin repeat protein
MAASATGHLDVVQALLDKGADVNAKGNLGTTALMGASLTGRLDVMQALLDKGADVNARTNNGMTALTVARNAAVQALLVQAGAKP